VTRYDHQLTNIGNKISFFSLYHIIAKTQRLSPKKLRNSIFNAENVIPEDFPGKIGPPYGAKPIREYR
jgi:hypothetical protein